MSSYEYFFPSILMFFYFQLSQDSSRRESEYREEIREKEHRIREEREDKVKAEAVAAR